MRVFKPPVEVPKNPPEVSVFLAGSIEMGKAVDWQKELTDYVSKNVSVPTLICNPRRDDWDSSWEQSINNKEFVRQVGWEMSNILRCDIVVFFIQADTKSPITLLELGLVATDALAGKKKVIVCCEEGFFRKGNVDIVSACFQMQAVKNLEELKKALGDMIMNGL